MQFSFIFKQCRKVLDDDEWQMVMSSYLSIVSRILLLNQMVFIQVLQELNVPAPFATIVDVWLRKMPLIGQPDKRKLLSKQIDVVFCSWTHKNFMIIGIILID